MRFRSLLPTVALLFAVPALAGETPTPAPLPMTPLHARKVCAVADLVVPVPRAGAKPAPEAMQKNADALVRLITSTIRPHTWTANGGTGTIEFHELGMALVVSNTPAAVADVCALLDAMRRAQGPQIVYEVRVLKTRVGFADRVGLKLVGDTALTEAQLRTLLEAAQGDRETNILMAPKVTAFDGQSVTVRAGEDRPFVTGGEAVKVQGQTVFVPKRVPVFLGDVIELSGTAAADDKSVQFRARYTRTSLNGEPEKIPVTTQVTPIFEGGSQGKPVPFTQFLQLPDVRTQKLDKALTVPTNGTVVLGSWKQPEEAKNAKDALKWVPNKEKAAECEVIVLATVRVLRFEEPEAQSRVYKLRNVAAADVAHALGAHEQLKKAGAVVTAEAVSNTILVSGSADAQKQVAELIAKLDKAVPQVLVQATIVEVPDGFLEDSGLKPESDPPGAAKSCLLTPREAQMFNALLRAAKEKGACEVLSRPQIQVGDNQTGYVNIGQQFPVPGANGKIEYKPVGITLRVTPRVMPDGKSVYLATDAQLSSVQPGAVLAGMKVSLLPGTVCPALSCAIVPAFNEQQVKTTAQVPFGHTLVTGVTTRVERRTVKTATGGLSEETVRVQKLIILTPHSVQSEADVKPAAKWEK